MRLTRFSLLLMAVTAVSLAGIVPARAAGTAVIHVRPGESIQAAVDAANPGDTILVSRASYAESIAITKDNLTIIGGGASDDGSVLVPPATPDGVCSTDAQDMNGFCMFGDFGSGTPVTGTTIKGFKVAGFSGFGIFGVLSNDHTIAGNLAEDNGGYGIACFVCSGGTYVGNTATGSGEAGFYQGDSPEVNSTMVGNTATNNGFGFFFRDAAGGTASNNLAKDNCIGFMMLDTGAPDVMGGWDMNHNNLFHNDKACPPSEEGPALSGVGLAMIGGVGNNVHDNTIWRNRPGGETSISGGIFVGSGQMFGGGDPTNNTFDTNFAYGNGGIDIKYTGAGTGNAFTNNDCFRSIPRSICAT
jgi:parallel beta-helix repeat protein